MKTFRLHHGPTMVELRDGEFVVGRGGECQLALDDPNVSRRHAAFRLRAGVLTVEDLGSSNGVKVNAERIARPTQVRHGDQVTIGNTVFRVSSRSSSGSITHGDGETLVETSRVAGGTDRLLSAAEQAFAAGKRDQASLMLTRYLSRQLRSYESGQELEALPEATKAALKAASITGNGSWIDWVLEAHRIAKRVLPIEVVDELFTLVRQVKPAPTAALRTYVQHVRDRARTLPANERFVLQRLEGLLRVSMAG